MPDTAWLLFWRSRRATGEVWHEREGDWGGFGHLTATSHRCDACWHGYVGPCRGYHLVRGQQAPCDCGYLSDFRNGGQDD